MRFLPTLLALCALPLAAHADALAVLGKNQISLVSPHHRLTAVPDDAAQQRFLFRYADFAEQTDYEATLPLVSPPEWGKTVPNSRGSVAYRKAFAEGFVGRLEISGLAPQHLYLLTLNGTPHHPGNDLLLDAVPGLPDERFYDFLRVRTDDHGAYQADLGILLKPGDYHVRIYVKDTDDFKIVLYRDFFDFAVEPAK